MSTHQEGVEIVKNPGCYRDFREALPSELDDHEAKDLFWKGLNAYRNAIVAGQQTVDPDQSDVKVGVISLREPA